MAGIKGTLLIQIPIVVDPRIRDQITLSTTTEIEQKIGRCFTLSFKLLADQIEKEGLKKMPKCNCLMADSDEVVYYLDEELATEVQWCYYPIHRWKDFNELCIMTCILEELCHYFWSTNDELEVKYKVLEIMRRAIENIELNNLYPKELIEGLIKEKTKPMPH